MCVDCFDAPDTSIDCPSCGGFAKLSISLHNISLTHNEKSLVSCGDCGYLQDLGATHKIVRGKPVKMRVAVINLKEGD